MAGDDRKPTERLQRRRILRASILVVGIIAAAAVAMGIAGWPISWSRAAARPLAVIASGDTAGWIMPCGCTANQSGGLARRGTYLKQAGETADVAAVDVGGAPGGSSPYDREKFLAILHGEAAMGVTAHNIGSAEAGLGASELKKLAADAAVPLVSTNVATASGELVAPPVKIVSAGGRRLAVFGVLSPQLAASGLAVSEPRAAVLAAIAKARGSYDAAIVLAYLPAAELEAFAAEMPEVDLVIGGPTRQAIAPRKLGPTWLASATNKGKFLARFDLPAARGAAWQGSIVEMAPSIADDPAQIANLESYHRELAKLDFTASQTSFAPQLPSGAPDDFRLVGSEVCRRCHLPANDVWEHSKHSRAWQTLVDRGYNFDSSCQQCHTTGFGMPGGFVSAGRSPARVAVGCESCHGPGAAHAIRPATRTCFAPRDQCIHCHDQENSPKFDFVKYWAEIRHGGKAD